MFGGERYEMCHNQKMMRVAIISLFASLACLISYAVIGSSVAPDGRLVEPFYLIPLAWLFLLNCIAFAAISLLMRFRR
jgi:hypothetical protein